MKKIFLLVILLLPFSSSSLFAVPGIEEILLGINMNDRKSIVGVAYYCCINEFKSPKLKKNVKEKIGWRISGCRLERKNDELKNSEVKNTSIKFIINEEIGLNEKLLFNTKILYGVGFYTHNEFTKSREEYLATSVILEAEIFVGVSYFLTKRFGLGIDVGYNFSRDINKDIENSEKFDPSGLETMLNFIFKFF
jgi:hypothetical protein